MSAQPFTAEALPHCNEVGLSDTHQLLGLLTRRQAIDLAAQLIKSADRIRRGALHACTPAEGLVRFSQEFGTHPQAMAVAQLDHPTYPA